MQTSKNKNRISQLFTILRILFGVVFIFSAIIKLSDIPSFEEAIKSFNLLSGSLLQISVYAIPIIELLLGISLVLNFNSSIASQLITLMVAFFTAVVVAKLFEGTEISCGCFGELSKDKIDGTTVIRNIVLMIWGITLTIFYQKDVKEEKKNTRKSKIIKLVMSTITVTLFFFLGVQSFIFALQNRELKVRLALFTTDRDVLKEDDEVKQFDLIDLEKNEIEINYNTKRKTLIFILSTNCSPCKENLPNWIQLTNKLKNKKVKILGIALNSFNEIKKYAVENSLNFSTYIPKNEEFKINYKGFLTPQTLLISKQGKVLKSIPGMLNEKQINELTELTK